MFLLLQFAGVMLLLAAVIILFGKVLHKSKGYVVGMSLLLLTAAVFWGVCLYAFPMPAEEVGISVSLISVKAENAEEDSEAGEEPPAITLTSITVDGRNYARAEKIEGNAIIDVPVGAGRKISFSGDELKGDISIAYSGSEEQYAVSLGEAGIQSIKLPDSDSFYDNMIKIVRLGIFGLLLIVTLGLAAVVVSRTEKEILIKVLCAGLSFVTTLTFCLNMSVTRRSGDGLAALFVDLMNSCASANAIWPIIMIPLLYRVYMHCAEIYREKFTSTAPSMCICIPTAIFSVFMVLGSSFAIDNTLKGVFGNELQVMKAILAFVGYFACFFFGLTWLFNFLNHVDVFKQRRKRHCKLVQMYLDCLNRRPFRTASFTLLISYIPYIIVSYPTILMGDTLHQLRLIYEVYPFDNAHPVVHTLFIKMCIGIGSTLFGSINLGLFIYSCLQLLFVIFVISLLTKLLGGIGVSSGMQILLILYYIVHPRVQNYMFVVTKDVINGAFFLVFVITLYMLFTGKHHKLIYALIGVSCLGMLLFRHDSVYIIVLSMLAVLMIMRVHKRAIIVTIICVYGFSVFWNNWLLPTLNIAPTKTYWNQEITVNSSQLGLIMVQQTGRYVRDASEDITDEEREAIDAVYDFDRIAKEYNPILSDNVGLLLRKDATIEDWKGYQRTWFKMFFKHPEIYIGAVLNHKYAFFYPM